MAILGPTVVSQQLSSLDGQWLAADILCSQISSLSVRSQHWKLITPPKGHLLNEY